jgi:TIR domain-containing protein
MKVFISYRREDSAGHSGRLHDSLQSHFGADNIFMDLSDIDSGQNFVDVIQGAVRSSDVVLAVIGNEWITCTSGGTRRLDMPNDFVRTEIGIALEHGIPVIPVLVRGARMPPASSLPEPLKLLASHDAHDLSDERWTYDVGRLIDATEKLAGKPALPRRWPLIAAVVIITAAIAAFLFVHSRQPQVVLAGEWSAEVTYDWGDKYTERFAFKVDGDEVLGTASFLGVPRGIVDGSLQGARVVFQTRTQEVRGDFDKPVSVSHRYRGTITGDTIAFTMQSEAGSSSVPVEFIARRSARLR